MAMINEFSLTTIYEPEPEFYRQPELDNLHHTTYMRWLETYTEPPRHDPFSWGFGDTLYAAAFIIIPTLLYWWAGGFSQ